MLFTLPILPQALLLMGSILTHSAIGLAVDGVSTLHLPHSATGLAVDGVYTFQLSYSAMGLAVAGVYTLHLPHLQ